MIVMLMPGFLLTAAMAAGGAYFVGSFVLDAPARQKLPRAALWALIAGAVFPVVYFGVYMLAKPKADADPRAIVSPEVALIPAVWVGLLLIGIAVGLWRAAARTTTGSRGIAPR